MIIQPIRDLANGRLCIMSMIYWICTHQNYRYQEVNLTHMIDWVIGVKYGCNDIIIMTIKESEKFQSLYFWRPCLIFYYVYQSMNICICVQSSIVLPSFIAIVSNDGGLTSPLLMVLSAEMTANKKSRCGGETDLAIYAQAGIDLWTFLRFYHRSSKIITPLPPGRESLFRLILLLIC